VRVIFAVYTRRARFSSLKNASLKPGISYLDVRHCYSP
jgi:hypothetical protein